MDWKFIIILISIVFFTACAEKSTMDQSNNGNEQVDQVLTESEIVDSQLVDKELVNREWILNSLDGESLINGTNIILAFEDLSFSGFGGCNGYGGQYETDGDGGIKFIEYASQAEGCIEPAGVLDQEISYLKQLMDMENYRVDSGVLTLSNPESGQTLIYSLREPFEIEPEMLDNSHWNLLSSDDFSLIEGSLITISFSNGKMEGFAGCRDYQGEYEAEGDQIRFPVTMMIGEICDDQDLLIQEGTFTTAFELAPITKSRMTD